MFRNQSYKNYKENLDFVRSCSTWDELDKLSKTINHKFLLNSKYKSKLRSVEKKIRLYGFKKKPIIFDKVKNIVI